MIASEKQEQLRLVVETLFVNATDWVTFYRETLGVHGIVRQMFPTHDELVAFERTDVYRDIQRMLTNLRKNGPQPSEKDHPTQVITVRLPKSVHDALRSEAFQHHTSMNKLCISKLMQIIDNENVPADFPRDQGGRPSRRLKPRPDKKGTGVDL